jgi:hypothetical protein
VNLKLATAALGAALILAGSAAFAADVQSGPIHIDNVRVFGGTTSDANASTIIVPGSTGITFTNQYAVPATDVVFVVENHGAIVDRFDDAGSFATGVTINHEFAENEASPELRVAVESATFADGTVWANPAVVQPTQTDANIGVAVNDR